MRSATNNSEEVHVFRSFALFKRLHRDIRLYMLAWGLIDFGYFGIFGVLFNLYLLRLGYGPSTIGLLVGSGQLVWGLAAIPAGLIGVRISNRRAQILGVSILAFTTMLLLYAEALPTSLQTGWLATCWIISWVGSSLMVVNASPYAMEVTVPEERQQVFALQQAFLGLFGFAGSLLAGILPSFFANVTGAAPDTAVVYWYALWLAPFSYLVAALLLRRTQPRPAISHETQHNHRTAMPIFIIVFVALIIFLQTIGEGTLRAFFNVYLDTSLHVPTPRIGLIMGIGQFLPVLSSLAAPLLMIRWGAGRTVVFTAIGSGILMLLLVLFVDWRAASIGYIGILLTISIAAVARGLYSQELVAPQWRTVMSAAFTLV
jgi:predicted MFS family arabinose efflux permease